MSELPRDWDKELANIDRLAAKTPPQALKPGPSAPGGPSALPAKRAVSSAGITRKEKLSTWLRVVLGAGLAAAMTQWPYPNGCGLNLFIYLGAAGCVVVAGLWGAISSWRRGLGLAHTIALLVVLAGGGLAGAEVLPRIGYAKHAATWFCP